MNLYSSWQAYNDHFVGLLFCIKLDQQMLLWRCIINTMVEKGVVTC